MKVALYARVSTEEQTKGYSLEAQVDAMRQYATSNSWELVREYEDGGYSGSNDKRPAFKQMIADALAGEFDAILVHKFDRFSRSREDAIVYKSLLRKKGVRVISVTEPLDDSPASFLTEGMLEVLNEFYLINLSQEIKKGKYKGAEKGEYQGGNLKFGYTLDNNDVKPKIVVDQKEANTVVNIFEKYAQGLSLGQLAIILNDMGMPCKTTGRWHKQKLSKMLRDRTYIGEGRYGEVIMPYPPIVPTDLFDQVQTKLSSNKNTGRPAKSGRTYLLSHLGRCGECGGALLHETQRQYKYIYCYRQAEYPDEHQCFKPKRINVDWLEQEIWNQVEDILYNYKESTYDLLLDKYENTRADRESQITKVRTKIEQCKTGKRTVLRQVRTGNITQAEADIEFTVIKKEQSDWQQELDSMLATNSDDDSVLEKFMVQLKALHKSFDFGFMRITPERQKEIINLLVEKFILYGDGKIELRFKLPVNEEQVAGKIRELSCDVLVV